MKEQRIIFLKKAKGTSIMGITQGEYVVDGQNIAAEKGGGKIASMVLKDGMIYIKKVGADGKPHRNFGSVSLPGGTMRPLIADGIAFPAHLTTALLFEDAETSEEKPAQPVQQQGQSRRQ